MEAVLEVVNKLIAAIPEASPMLVASVAFALDLIMRLIKSQKPIGVLHGLAGALKAVGALLSKSASFLDKVLPQRVEQPEEAPKA
jgi:hypothetical protein